MLPDLLIILSSMMRLCEQIRRRTCLASILICRTGNLLPWTRNVAELSHAYIALLWCQGNHRQRSPTASWAQHSGLNGLWLRMAEINRSTTINNVTLVAEHSSGIGTRFGGCCVSGFRPTWSLLASHVRFRETLLPCLCLPVIIAHSSSIHNHSAAKLPKHGFCRNYRDLAGPVREREDLLMDQVFLFLLCSNNLI